ncbi:ParA family protein, partial [Phocaeicola vulgatus]|nr:ParA family protein [Phocaeicola vulgatus]MDC1714466.1 ParA family protein [Phocaeicola vulgatus]MDC1719270.1 ParA family protein [Phocaeicola vulgatus]MDC1723679.1 ParA family protein [Phocaeicola vulgatus]
MINGTFKYPEIRFFGYLPKRIPEPSETRFSDNSVTYGFNDFMTQCRQSPFVRRTASPQNRIRDDPPACVVTEADGATAKSVWKQKNKSSTIKINGTMSKEIFVAFATQKGGIG